MIIIKKKNIKIIYFKKIFKINKNYIKNFKISFEVNNNNDNAILVLNALNGSQHVFGTYKSNLKNVGWWNKVIKNFKNFKIIGISSLNSSYCSTNNSDCISLGYKKNFFSLKLNYKNTIKVKINILRKLKIKKYYICIGGSNGGIKNFIFLILYPKKIKFSLSIAVCKKLYLRNKIKNYNNLKLIKKFFYNNKKKNFLILKNFKIVRNMCFSDYLSKKDKNSKNKRVVGRNMCFKKYKKNIFKYLNYKSNIFIKFFNINCYISNIKNFKNFKFNKKGIKKNKNILIIFKNDNKFKVKESLKSLKYILKIKRRISLKFIKNKNGHDAFLLHNEDYIKNLKNILNIRSDKIWTYDYLIPNQVR